MVQPKLFECSEEPRPALTLKNWFPRLKAEVHQHDIYEPAGQATFHDLSKFDPLLWATAYGDTADEREESYCQLRAHVGRKLGKYRKVKGKGFAAWITTVCHNWKAGELRKKRVSVTQIDEDTAESVPDRDDVQETELGILFDDLPDHLYLIYLWMRDDIGTKERNAALKRLGFGQSEHSRLEQEFRVLAASRLGLCVPMGEDAKRPYEPSKSDT